MTSADDARERKLYFARANGNLYSMGFANGAPTRGTEALVSPKSDGYDWASNGLFVFTHITVDTDPPTTPCKPAGSSPAAGTITINWAASTDASPPITYSVYRDANPTAIGSTTSTSFTDTDAGILTPGSSHTYTVDAVDSLNPNTRSQMSPLSEPIVVAAASVTFADDFSSNDFTKWSGSTRLTIHNSTGGVAAPSARAAVTAQTAFAYKNLSGTFSTMCMSANVNATSFDANLVTLLMLRTAANGPIVRVFANASGILYVKSDVSNLQFWSGSALGSGWHNIEGTLRHGRGLRDLGPVPRWSQDRERLAREHRYDAGRSCEHRQHPGGHGDDQLRRHRRRSDAGLRPNRRGGSDGPAPPSLRRVGRYSPCCLDAPCRRQRRAIRLHNQRWKNQTVVTATWPRLANHRVEHRTYERVIAARQDRRSRTRRRRIGWLIARSEPDRCWVRSVVQGP